MRGPRVVWAGWDARGGSGAKPGAAERFASESGPAASASARYELLAVTQRGFRPPEFLSVSESGAALVEVPGFRQLFALVYRELAATGPVVELPYAIYLLGVNPPEGLSDAELAEFNDFYTTVHLVEVAERRHALRAVRYELEEAIRAPYQGAPRFLAAYELDERGAATRRHVGPPYSAGPEVWQRHRTPWRLWYRRLG